MPNYNILTSNKYKKGMKWLQVPENKIDTVIFNPISNTFTESVIVAEETFGTVTVGSTSLSLPCSTSASVDISNPSYNYYESWGGLLCKGNAFMKKARITHTFNLENPISGTPVLKVILSGKTRRTARGSIAFGTMPSYDDSSAGVANFIDANKNGDDVEWTGDSDIKLYSQHKINVCPWIKKYQGYDDSTVDNIITRWHGQPQGGVLYTQDNPNYSDWNTYGVSGAVGVYPNPYYPPIDWKEAEPYVSLLPKKYEFILNVTRINGRRFSIDIEIPIMFIYTAASRMGSPSAGDHRPLIDSFAAYDLITSVTVQLIGTTLDDSTTTRSYSLDGNGELTENVKNKSPFTFNKNELITLGTRYNLYNWMSSMGKYILTEYKTGKYIIEADIDARYLIENNITINTPLMIKNLNNEYIKRGDRICLFEIKTIEKKYKDGSFTYTIKALEASYSTVDIGNIGAVYVLKPLEGETIALQQSECLYFNDTNGALITTGDEQIAQENMMLLGNNIALPSSNTKLGNFLLVPGKSIGRKIIVMLKTGTNDYDNQDLDFIIRDGGRGESIEVNEYYSVINNQKQSKYFVVLITLTNYFIENAFGVYIRKNNHGPLTIKEMQLYNAGNIDLTAQEAYEWLVNNNKLI